MVLKNKILIFLLSFLFYSWSIRSQANFFPKENSFKEYRKVFFEGLKYYQDSIKKNGDWLIQIVYLQEFDTLNQQLKYVIDCDFYNPIPEFNATHYKKIDNVITFFRFDKKIDTKVIKRLGLNNLNKKYITEIDKLVLQKRKKVTITGYLKPLVYKFSNNKANISWHESQFVLPIEDRIIDMEYIRSRINYYTYLNSKLKEYGYR